MRRSELAYVPVAGEQQKTHDERIRNRQGRLNLANNYSQSNEGKIEPKHVTSEDQKEGQEAYDVHAD